MPGPIESAATRASLEAVANSVVGQTAEAARPPPRNGRRDYSYIARARERALSGCAMQLGRAMRTIDVAKYDIREKFSMTIGCPKLKLLQYSSPILLTR